VVAQSFRTEMTGSVMTNPLMVNPMMTGTVTDAVMSQPADVEKRGGEQGRTEADRGKQSSSADQEPDEPRDSAAGLPLPPSPVGAGFSAGLGGGCGVHDGVLLSVRCSVRLGRVWCVGHAALR
jgi:hypothetical protein